MRDAITASTSTMTSVPKPIKFLRPHYKKIKDIYGEITADEAKVHCGDVISLLAMTQDDELRDCLNFRLKSGGTHFDSFGHGQCLCEQWVEQRHGNAAAVPDPSP